MEMVSLSVQQDSHAYNSGQIGIVSITTRTKNIKNQYCNKVLNTLNTKLKQTFKPIAGEEVSARLDSEGGEVVVSEMTPQSARV